MLIYIFLTCFLIALSVHYDINKNKKNKRAFYLLVQLCFIVIAGLRYRIGSDTAGYVYFFYHEYPSLEDFSFSDYPIGKDPFYVILNSAVISLGGRFFIVQFLQSIIVTVLSFSYIKKHSNYIFTCAFFYFFSSCYFYYNMEIMRAGISVVLCLYANDYILERKWLKGYLLYIVAIMFHAQSILMLVIPLLFFLKFDKKGICMLIGAFLLGKIIQTNLQDYITLMSLGDQIQDRASFYALDETYSKQSRNINYMIVRIFPMLIYSILCLHFSKKNMWNERLQRIQPFVMLGVFFLIIQMNFQIAYRFVDYFRIHFVIYLSEFFLSFVNDIRFEKRLSMLRAIVVFIPFFFLTGYCFIDNNPSRYIPYKSVLSLELDPAREALYSGIYPPVGVNEY